ncbi:MAG: DUF1028 domain-containing protein [bacterium]|nr:DUF1028 domain-containing protein [Candidatus Kapabacteria bacterium]
MINVHVILALLSISTSAIAQDTFSIVAVDPATGEVGSAGASCVQFDVAVISDLHPGLGAINTQAYHNGVNQRYAGSLMIEGISPAAIIDSMYTHDVHDNPAVRQYGIAALANGGSAAAFTGDETFDYKGHRLGKTYAVQGNILLGSAIIDSIADRFERAQGSLAERLMFALMGGRVVGADTRCAQYGTSSLGAYIQVARPGDRSDSFALNLSVSISPGAAEPLDSLAKMFLAWRLSSVDVEGRAISRLTVEAIDGDDLVLRVELARRADVHVEIFDVRGQRVATAHEGTLESGAQRVTVKHAVRASTGTCYARVTCGREVRTTIVQTVR